MSLEFVLRLIGMVVLAVGGVYLGAALSTAADMPTDLWAVVFALVGALVGLIGTPFFTTRPARVLRRQIMQLPASALLAGMTGLVVGLIVAGLLSFPMSLLPRPFGQVLPMVGAVVFAWLGISIFVMRQRDIFSLFRGRLSSRLAAEGAGTTNEGRSVLIDTSVIIDGRIADISHTGFISGTILVPKFVLNELQHIADSPDALRRNRGRRGLEVLNRLTKEATVPVRFTDMDVPGVREVDDKLVILAKQLNCAVITNDYNLNHVAQLQGVTVLNINELANAVKAVFLHGEALVVKIIQEGREVGQGVGYLDDGTMVVVDDGRSRISEEVSVIVTKVLQTTAGRMIFAKLESNHNHR
ncbi:MAG: TRAM domain-containing protein [Anaerolineales bacterium]|nr:TRAM domain-containing protein [Anaerolineales bacterium]